MPEITVVITSYNLESYIAGCLDELFGQSFQDFNILIVDDCSKDRTVLMIRDYQSNFPERLRLIEREKNLGSPARTRNAAMDSGFIDGRFVIFLDGDDHLEPDFRKSCILPHCVPTLILRSAATTGSMKKQDACFVRK